MHFFGAFGFLSFFLGMFLTTYLIGEKIYCIYSHLAYRNVTDNPLFYLALVAIILGSQLFLAGFLGELFVKQGVKKEDYFVIEKVGL